MTRTYVLTLRQVPRSVNRHGGGVGVSAGRANSEKQRWEQLYGLELMAGKVAKGMSSCALEIVVRWRRRNHADEENYRHPIIKPLADALVNCGYLPDDTGEFFKVRDLRFEYPAIWPYQDPRIKAEMVICIEAEYASSQTDGPR